MTLPAPTYDLVLLLDIQAEQDERTKIVADARAAIEAQGELLRHDGWGERALSYPIERKANAEYHLLQFHAGDNALLDGLDRTLRITDGVMRFRIIKLAPGVPDAPAMAPAPAAAVARTEPDAVAAPAEVSAPAAGEAPAEVEAPAAPEPQPDASEPEAAAEAAVAEPA
jgi:small subunit ribosomal protein S6